MSLVDLLNRLSYVSRNKASMGKVQNVARLLNREMLKQCYNEIPSGKAVGVDGISKEKYGENLDQNLDALIFRLKNGIYYPQPSRRVLIPKPGTKKMRKLGISCFEDKIVERAIGKILMAIYECRFFDCSFGFRPERNCHMAISKALMDIRTRNTRYVVEADIRSCFDTIDHNWLIEMLERDIADRKFIELIRRGLKAGHFEGNLYYDDELGVAQGSGYSPVLANVYLHYALDYWFVFKAMGKLSPERNFRGKASLIRYADDFIATFEFREDAMKFYNGMKQRLGKFGFSLAEEKTRVIQFGKFAEQDAKTQYQRGLRSSKKPDTFDFLGFTFYCSKAKKKGAFCPKVKSIGKRMTRKLSSINTWLKENRHRTLKEIFRHINRVLEGYFNYYAVTCNSRSVNAFRYMVTRMIFKWLNRRSQRESYTWEQFRQVLEHYPIAKARIRVDVYEYYSNRSMLQEPYA